MSSKEMMNKSNELLKAVETVKRTCAYFNRDCTRCVLGEPHYYCSLAGYPSSWNTDRLEKVLNCY